jgi:hypothetical protein
MMKILVSSVSIGQFEVNCAPNTKVEKLKEEIVQLVNRKGVELPKENNLIYKGKLLDSSKTITESGIADSDPILLLYNLKLAVKLVQAEPEISIIEKVEIQPEEPIKEEKIEKPEPAQVMPAHEPIPELVEANFSPEQLERIAMVASQIDWNEFPMPNPEDLERLMETGFSKWRCQKALLLNQFDPEAALDWLCSNIEDPTIDDPISTLKLAQIIMEVSRHVDGPQVQNQSEQIAEAVRNNKCTYTVTGKNFVQQKWYFCYTCGFVDSEGVCEGCANVCHKGHSLSAVRGVEYGSGFFCDCGSGDSCICNK